MNATVLAIRAVSSQFARGLLLPILLIGVGAYVVVMGLAICGTVSVTRWWILLGILASIVFTIALALWLAAWLIVKRVAPDMTNAQRRAAKEVVDQLNTVAERIGTPRFLLLFQVIKDVIAPPKNKRTLIGELTDTPGQLHRSFESLRKLF